MLKMFINIVEKEYLHFNFYHSVKSIKSLFGSNLMTKQQHSGESINGVNTE